MQENAFEIIVYEIAAILSRPRYVKDRGPYHTRLLLIHEENKALKYSKNLQECQKYLNFLVWKIPKSYLISKSHEK